MSSGKPIVDAAGGVLWREGDHGREVAMVHRPRYDDWSLPKGKRKTGEPLLLTGAREVTEETGYVPEVGPYLGRYSYEITSNGRPAIKRVKYWSMRAAEGAFVVNDEVDELVWMDSAEAAQRSRFPTDGKVLEAFELLPARTASLLVVRNGSAVRASRRVPADKRGLDTRGSDQAAALVPVLATLGVETLLSTASRRCQQTLQPYADTIGMPVDMVPALAASAQSDDAVEAAANQLLSLVQPSNRVAVCAEGAVTSRLVAALGSQLGAGKRQHPTIPKGGWCLLHVGAGALLSIERQEAA